MADIPGDASTTSSLTVGSTVTGVVDFVDDHDWYRIDLTAGQAITVTLTGLSGTLSDTYLNIRDSSGNIIFSNDDISDSNLNSQVSFSAPTSGTYYIDVSAWHDPTGAYQGTGNYQVSVQPYSPPPLWTNDQIANQLTTGYWGGDTHHFNVTQGGTITVNISTLTAAEQNLARTALQEWSDIIGVRFQEVTTTGAQIRFDDTEQTNGQPIAATDGRWQNGIITSEHVHISTSWVTRYGTSLNSYSFQTYLHEIGHALGLGHAGNYNNTATYPYDALFQNDAWSTSIMSYFDQHENTYFGGQGFTVNFDATPMVADILAMQQLYGLSTTTRTGDTTYGYNSNAGGVFDATVYPKAAYTIFDSGGNDTLDFSGNAAAQVINLNPETFSNVNGYVGNLSIARGVVIENAVGGSGADKIIGNSVANVIRGGLGADTLTGGGGNDTFLDTKAGHNGDTITDFTAGDSIVFSDATLGSFTFSLSGKTLTYSGGSLTFGSLPVGTIVASGSATGGVQLTLSSATTPVHHAHNDIDGNGRSDLLLRDVSSGWLTDWLSTPSGGFTINNNNAATQFTLDWKVAGTGDFNGDGRVDFLLRQDGGQLTEWLGTANGGFTNNGPTAGIFFDNDWKIVGIGDFNGDGRDDFLLRNSEGWTTDWLGTANGSFTNNGANAALLFTAEWSVAGTGDFNGDGISDFLLRSNQGWLTEWLGTSNGGFTNNGPTAGLFFTNDWQVKATGDFNGDGITDFLLRQDGGQFAEWLGTHDGSFVNNGATGGVFFSPDWQIVGVGDFNGDSIDDFAIQNSQGWTTDWLGHADGSFTNNSANVVVQFPASLHVQDPFL